MNQLVPLYPSIAERSSLRLILDSCRIVAVEFGIISQVKLHVSVS